MELAGSVYVSQLICRVVCCCVTNYSTTWWLEPATGTLWVSGGQPVAPRLAPRPQGLSQAVLQCCLVSRLDWGGTRFQATHVALTGLGSSRVLGFLLHLGQRPSSPLAPWACTRTAPTGRPTPRSSGRAEPGGQPVATPMCPLVTMSCW